MMLATMLVVGEPQTLEVCVRFPQPIVVECQRVAECPPCPPFDAMDNLRLLGACLTGPGPSPDSALRWPFRPVDKTQLCSVFDRDGDGDWDVDLADFAVLQNTFKGGE